MTYPQYCRIETAAGGVTCTARQFIREARKVLSAQGKSREMRVPRHKWLRHGLYILKDARQVYRAVTR